MSDFQTGSEYLEGQEEIVTDLNDPRVVNETSSYFDNAPTTTCTLIPESGGRFRCVKHDYWYGVLTFVFIFAPSANVLLALMGRVIGGAACMLWGVVMFIVGVVLRGVGQSVSVTVVLLGNFIFFLGPILLFIGLVGAANDIKGGVRMTSKNNWQCVLLAPIIILLSPLIIVITDAMALLRPDSEFIQRQKKLVKHGESLLEASPQLCLQLFVVMRTMNPSNNQIQSIVTSALSVPIANCEKYLETIDMELGTNLATPKSFLVLGPQSLFRLVALSTFIVFFELGSAFIIVGNWIVLAITVFILARCCWKGRAVRGKEGLEAVVLSFLTITNFGKTEVVALWRLVSTYVNFVFYTVILIAIGVVCNHSPDILIRYTSNLPETLSPPSWSKLAVVTNIFYLNLTIILTILGGAAPLLVDVFLAWLSRGDGGWGWSGTYFHQYLQRGEEDQDPDTEMEASASANA